MAYQFARGGEGVETVLVCCHPEGAVALLEDAHDARLAYWVLRAFVAPEVVHGVGVWRLHIDAFLQECEPQVACHVFGYGVHFHLVQVYIVAVQAVGLEATSACIEKFQAETVGAHEDVAVPARHEGGDGHVGCGGYQCEAAA